MSDKKDSKIDFKNFSYQQFLDDKATCKEDMIVALCKFQEKYKVPFESVSVVFVPGFGDAIDLPGDIIMKTL